jgi:2-polyprenyl-6-methoxyphenol hydroxylase-like FAD-dependent oxidoreductase
MADRFDVIVVGARCAGAPLAALLARQGLDVALVERAKFPKDTLSTHIIQAPAINFLKRLGVLERTLVQQDQPAPGGLSARVRHPETPGGPRRADVGAPVRARPDPG